MSIHYAGLRLLANQLFKSEAISANWARAAWEDFDPSDLCPPISALRFLLIPPAWPFVLRFLLFVGLRGLPLGVSA